MSCKCHPEVHNLPLAFHGVILRSMRHRARKMKMSGESLRHVERAGSACAGAFHDVEVNHGGGHVGMAEEVLDGSDVDAAFEQVGGNTRVIARS